MASATDDAQERYAPLQARRDAAGREDSAPVGGMQVVPHGRWSASPQHGGNAAAPALTVAIHQGVVHVEADLPGMNLQDIRVSVAEGTLTVRGLHCMYGVIERVVNLPRHVRAEAMRVRRERNQLEIDLPVETEAPNGA